jgi:hypothetical protein
MCLQNVSIVYSSPSHIMFVKYSPSIMCALKSLRNKYLISQICSFLSSDVLYMSFFSPHGCLDLHAIIQVIRCILRSVVLKVYYLLYYGITLDFNFYLIYNYFYLIYNYFYLIYNYFYLINIIYNANYENLKCNFNSIS